MPVDAHRLEGVAALQTLMFVNLREQADAEIALIDSLAEAQTAIARALTANGESLFE